MDNDESPGLGPEAPKATRAQKCDLYKLRRAIKEPTSTNKIKNDFATVRANFAGQHLTGDRRITSQQRGHNVKKGTLCLFILLLTVSQRCISSHSTTL